MDRRRVGGIWRWRLFSGIWLVYLAPGFVQAWTDHTGVGRWLRLLLLVAFCYVYADLVGRGIVHGGRLRWGAPALLTLLAAVLWAVIGADGLGVTVYIAVSVIVLHPLRVALPIAAALTLLTGLAPFVIPSWRGSDSWSEAAAVALACLAAFGFVGLIRRTHELREAQEEVSRLAAERERMRIARDLHDLLGHSLTAVTVKAELAGRLAARDPARAEAEMLAVAELSRQALVDVRAAVAGYRAVSLAVELATARELLGAAGMTADLPRVVDEVPGPVRELFGWVVREGVTNAIRHSRARTVRVTVTPSCVEVHDDGVGAARPPGSGLTGLAERAAAAGATLTAGPDAGGWTVRLVAAR
jgi:two-component system, NarL family, sensor histidine kinase DesK